MINPYRQRRHAIRIDADPGRLRSYAARTKIDHIEGVVTLGQRKSETDC